MANKTLKHFSLFGVNFTQRPSDLYIDCSELCKQRNKPLSNWTRTSNAKEYLSKVENSLIITNSKNHTWIHEKCLKGLLQFLDINYGEKYHELEAELDKDFPNSGPITEKICSCCKLNKSIDNFGVNKNKSDGYDIRCKECYKKDREKTKDYHNTRSTEYYHNNKEHCLKVKKEWQHNNVEKTRVANKRYTIKKQTEKHDNKEKIKSGIINDLESINIDDNNLRRNELLDICKEFNIPVYAKDNKNIIIGKINNYISTHKDDNEDEDEKSEDEEENSDANEEVEIEDNIDLIIENNILTLNNIEIIARKLDGFINATQMCKAGGKQFYHWKENKHSEQFIRILSMSVGIPTDEIIKYENGSNNKRSTWCHPRVAINIAQWISAEFNLKVTEWVQELLTTRSVTVQQEKTANEKVEIEDNIDLIIENNILTLNDIKIIARKSDGFINATQMCKAGGKEFGHWYELNSTKELITTLEGEFLIIGIPGIKIVDVKIGRYGSSWIHPDLAVQLAQWISPAFAIKVSRWIRELSLTGSVTLNQEKTANELDNLWKQKLNKIQIELKQKDEILIDTVLQLEREKKKEEIEIKHKKLLKKRVHYKFKTGPCFYIISDIDSKTVRYKIGIDDTSINERLRTYRTSIPGTKLEFLIYTDKNRLIEQSILQRYEDSTGNYTNHEWIFNVEVDKLIEAVNTYINFANIKCEYEVKICEYNKDIFIMKNS